MTFASAKDFRKWVQFEGQFSSLLRLLGIFTLMVMMPALHAQVVYVDPAATGSATGDSWGNAITDIQTALDAAAAVATSSSPMQVWIKSGSYQATTGTDRNQRFELKSYVEVYGGFTGSETTLSQRDVKTNPTIFSGDIGISTDQSDNSYVPFQTQASLTGPIVLDGLTIEDYYDPTNTSGSVGLILLGTGSMVTELRYNACVFNRNEISLGSVYGFANYPAVFLNSEFYDNGGSNGVTLWMNHQGTLQVINCVFSGNSGSLVHQRGTIQLINNTFYDNLGTVVSLQNQPTPVVTELYNNIFWGNPGLDVVVGGTASQHLSANRNLIEDAFSFGSFTLTEDPQFVDASSRDLRLKHCSPAIDNGAASDLPGTVTTDVGGNSRIFGTAPDLGANELQASPVSFAAIEVGDVSCNGGSDGQISVNGGGGTGAPLEYSIDGATFQSSGVFTNLSAGSYQVYIRDTGVGCEISQTLAITEPTAITIDFDVNQSPAMNTITIQAAGGESPYTYSLDGINFSSSDPALGGAGLYTLYARDLGGCVATRQTYLTAEGRQVFFVDANAVGGGTGIGWSQALNDLQAAIDLAADAASVEFPAEVWVKSGTYYPTVQTSTDRSATIVLKNLINLRGGFAGNETQILQRDITTNPTILSGDIGVMSDSTDNSYGMLTVGSDVANEATVDGWTFRGAFSLAVEPTNGAIHMVGTAANLNVINSTFQYNLSNEGACIRMKEAISSNAQLTIQSSTFAENGFYTTSQYIGSAIFGKNRVNIYNSLFYDNKSGRGGALMTDFSVTEVNILNSTFYNNSGGSFGGLFYISQTGSDLTLQNSIMNGNYTGTPGSSSPQPPIFLASGNHIIKDNIVDQVVNGTNNLVVDPDFVDAVKKDFRITHCSPAVNGGDDSLLPSSPNTDLAGNPRQFNEVDLGAYEVQADPLEITSTILTQTSCFGGNDGQIELQATSGFLPLSYSIDGGAFISASTFSGLTAGSYSVVVRDNNGCERTTNLSIQGPDLLSFTTSETAISCFDRQDGVINVNATGGTGQLSYSIDGGSTMQASSVFENLDIGTYDVIVQDQNSCSSNVQQVILTQPAATLTPSIAPSNNTIYGTSVAASDLVITPQSTDNVVSHYQVSSISGGQLFLADGVTSLAEEQYITRAQGDVGLIFRPSNAGSGSFTIQSAASDADACLGGNLVTSSITTSLAPLTVLASDQLKVYGDAVPMLEATFQGFVNGEDETALSTLPTLSTTATMASTVGTYPITASAATASNYAISYTSGTLTVAKASLAAAANDKTITYGEAIPALDGTLSGVVNSDNIIVTYSTSATAVSDAGTYPITVGLSDPDTRLDNYDPTLTDGTLTINKADQTLTFATIDQVDLADGNTVMLAASSDAALAITYALEEGDGSIDNGILTLNATGTFKVQASQNGNVNYNEAVSVSQTFEVIDSRKSDQTITFDSLTSKVYGDAAITLAANASSQLPVSYAVTGPASMTGSELVLTGAGEVAVTAMQEGNASFNAATSVTRTFVVSKAKLIVTPIDQSITYGDAIPELVATYSGFVGADDSSDLSATASLVTTATVSSNAGSYDITATGGEGENYNFEYQKGTLTIDKASQTISFPTITDVDIASSNTVTLAAVATSGLAINYSLESGEGSIAASTLTLNATGTFRVVAQQPGSINYTAAESQSQEFKVTDSRKGNQTITFDAISDQIYGNQLTFAATATSGLAIEYQLIAGEGNLEGNVLTLTGVGQYEVTASQSGNDSFNPADEVTQLFSVVKAPLSFAADDVFLTEGEAISTLTYTVSGFRLSDDLNVIDTLPMISTVATPESIPGSYPITLTGGADNHYAISVAEGVLTIEAVLGFDDMVEVQVYPNPASHTISFDAKTLEQGIVRIVDLKGQVLIEHPYTKDGMQIDIAELAAGTYLLQYIGAKGVMTQKLLVEKH